MDTKCSFCNKQIPQDSIFCVHCGKDQRTYQPTNIAISNNEDLPNKASLIKRFSATFNLIILIIAIACIGGFIYYYIENKLNKSADKNAKHEQIVNNLYRNTKYKFRIKFPKQWDIKKGDGPNILVKSSNDKGSSINIYVKDLGVAVGDIDDLFTIDEWAATINESFPGAEILEKKEVLVDNRKAFYVKYSLKYRALDKEINGILYSVALTNNNLTYTITAGSGVDQFDEEKPTLDQSIMSFVVEDYNGDQELELIEESDYHEKGLDKDTKPKFENRPWFRNVLYGVSFETPARLEEQTSKPPEGYEELIQKTKTYFSKEDDIIVYFMYVESKFDTYDKKTGLNGSISNMVNSMNGTDLILDFSDPKNKLDDLKCSGSFKLKGSAVMVKGYVYWNGKGKFFLLTTMGEEKTLASMSKIINSVKIAI